MKTILYTPQEIINRNPILKEVWTAQSIGYLIKCQLFKAVKTSRYNLLDEKEVLKFFYTNFPEYISK